MEHPAISIVVCTRDRPESLARCLAALGELDYPDYEVIVVDNASRDGATRRVVAGTPFRYVREERGGLDWARNRGAAAARHAIVAYTDDDTEAAPGWLRGLARAFVDPRVAAVTGQVIAAELRTEAHHLFEQYGGMGRGTRAQVLELADLSPHDLIASHLVGVGANMAFRRDVLERLGGFDTALDIGTPAYGAGDLDMFHRVLVAGLRLRYEPAAVVRHHHREDIAALRRQLYANGRSFGVYLLKLWRRRTVARDQVAWFAARWIGGWVIVRLARGLTGSLPFPPQLTLAELIGACHAPWAYVVTYRRDQRLRSSRALAPAEIGEL